MKTLMGPRTVKEAIAIPTWTGLDLHSLSKTVDSLWLIQHIQNYSFFNPKRSCL